MLTSNGDWANFAFNRGTGVHILNKNGWKDFIINNSGDPNCDPTSCELLKHGCNEVYSGTRGVSFANDIITFNSDVPTTDDAELFCYKCTNAAGQIVKSNYY
jgi:hypothetical protein